jgi:predicted ATPase
MPRRRKPTHQTKLYTRLAAARLLIETNPTLFTLGHTFPSDFIGQYFNVPQPTPSSDMETNIRNVSRYNLKMTYYQVLFNKLLNQRGLYMSKRGSNYRILTRPQTEAKVESLYEQSRRKQHTANVLHLGISSYQCRYSPITDTQLLSTISRTF